MCEKQFGIFQILCYVMRTVKKPYACKKFIENSNKWTWIYECNFFTL